MQRRGFLAGSAASIGMLLAGCTTEGDTGGQETGESTDSEGTPYTVSMAPVGEIEFDAPPERVTSYFPGYADMCVALGVEDSLTAMAEMDRYHTGYYDELGGVSVDTGAIDDILGDEGIDKEIFYELDSDLHLIDPEWLINNSFFGLERHDVDEIDENVAPFMGNTIFRRTDEWHDYRYYTMYEAFEVVAEIFQRHDRYEALKSVHDEYIADIQSRLPPADDRPNALLVYGNGDEPEEFSPYRLVDEGTNKKQFRDLGIEDALSGTGIEGLSTSERGTIDYETMLEVDPDVVLVRGHEEKSAAEFADTVLGFMQDHDVASELTAVQNERVFRGGPIYQGPIINLFTTERAATEIYPETFEGELFDRGRVSELLADD